ncbi:pilus assembly protein TadG-related protein [Methylobacillus flagellatus]|uniref:pilus assembly protein TadG-related protein n=1 Tax=Methylobacillus flagellatus TaxID=405 RepID=UPI0010F47DC0|nr:pilus assembly protein TadG-related protein [Methylobacillus flagellatus]
MHSVNIPRCSHAGRQPRQAGAVAIMFGLTVFLLFGFMALAIDLGRAYVVRSELQNAADAAALAGARELNQTLAGVSSAVSTAIAIAAQNEVFFSEPVSLSSSDIRVGNCPSDSCMVPISAVTSNALARGKTFMRVSIPSGDINTFFARLPAAAGLPGTSALQTYGLAVAGRFVNDVTPIGVCALDQLNKGKVLPSGELEQYGYRRGMSYNIFTLGNLAGLPSDPYLINPVDAPPAACNSSNSSASNTAPFVCTGSSAVVTEIVPNVTKVYGNTGYSAGPIERALNSRFNIYGSGNNAVCIPSQAPPDSNIRDYSVGLGLGVSRPPFWMDPLDPTTPNQQSVNIVDGSVSISSKHHYGALWSYSRAVRAVGSTPNATAGSNFTPLEWATLYPLGALPELGYPGGSLGTQGSPYAETSGNNFQSPPTNGPGLANRRVLNLVIVNCHVAAAGSGSCRELPVLGIGRFFMQTPANLSGNPKQLHVEFAGLIEPVPLDQIKLYR